MANPIRIDKDEAVATKITKDNSQYNMLYPVWKYELWEGIINANRLWLNKSGLNSFDIAINRFLMEVI